MESFIFEDQLENVKSKKTQEYLSEVLSTYHNKEYRSCIVMLYAVSFIDILEKAKLLSVLYHDAKAISFLEDYQVKRAANARYSELEGLVRKFAEQKNMLNDVELKQWDHLKDYRDQCAHPVVSLNLELISPNKEQVRAHIRNMFEAIFLKDAILHGKVFDEFIETIKGYYDRNELDRFDEFIKARYLSRLDLTTKQQFLKNLWKFCFYSQESDCEEYRSVANYALIMILNSDKAKLINFFEKEKEFFNGHIYFEKINIDKDSSDIHFHSYSSTSLLYFLFNFPEIVLHITEGHLEDIKNLAFKNINYLLISNFLFISSNEHILKLKEEMPFKNCLNSNILEIIWQQAYDKFDYSYFDFMIYYFYNCQNTSTYSPDYDCINFTYTYILKYAFPFFSELQINDFLNKLTSFYKSANCFCELASQLYNIIIEKKYLIDFSSFPINIESIVQSIRK